ncbi:AAA family ATPase [Trinickia violacea]|uniref:AAA family ATPase n=1 Tax=Trinickia violacea TaxID=2571746 RepID=A0A4P8IWD5_9BURK|nr:winged helix-turn-helix domain-containing protein [Trinickia violacea]QCP53648.1 AAA family ATPase [Trinickia violacea]
MIQIGILTVDFEQRDIRAQGEPLRIGARAFDILEVLHRAHGAIVSKDDIMDAVWPGLIVEENRLQVHIATLRKMLGASRDLIKTVPGRGYALVAAPLISPLSTRLAPEASEAPLPADRPRSHSAPLIGRQAEIAHIIDMIDRTPVVTLVGAGGIGKTSLALQVAHDLESQARKRVHFVELARASARDDVLRALADALGQTHDEALSIDAIAEAAAASSCLLVLDNAEHVVDLIASLVETLATRADTLRVLVTSREPLHISAESVFRVNPLTVPDGDASAEQIAGSSAAELFLCRTRAATPDCAIDASGLKLIGDICRRLDGLPLAIELAAARVATLGIDGVASRLDDRLNLLTGGLRSALPRHQALRATFDWSYVLLDPAARLLFRRMGCFIGPFTFDAAHAVAQEPGASIADMIAGLGELVAKSLLTVEFSGSNAQYRLTESTRAYALEKLRSEGELERVAARYARYEREQAEARASSMANEGIPDLQSMADNAGEPRAGANQAQQASRASALALELQKPSRMSEYCAHAKQALDTIDAGPPGTVDAESEMQLRAAYATALLHTTGDVHAAAAMWDRTLGLARDAGHVELEEYALTGQWNTMLAMSDVHESLRYATRFERAAERRGERSQRLLATTMVATSLHYFGEHAQARERFEAATSALADAGEMARTVTAFALDAASLGRTMLTRLVWIQGEPEHAMRLAAQAIEFARRDRSGLALCVVLGAAVVPIALRYGDHDAISDYLETMRSVADANGFDIWRSHAECLAGQFDIQAGHPGAGLARLEPALRRVEASGFQRLLAPLIVAYAEGLVRTGRAAEAREKLDTTLARCRACGEHLFVPELLRAKGLAMLEQARNAAADLAVGYEAEGRRHLHAAIDIANEQGAGMWALRATLDLADHLIERGRGGQASSMIANLSGRFDLQSRASDIRRLVRLRSFVRADDTPPARQRHVRFESTADAAPAWDYVARQVA